MDYPNSRTPLGISWNLTNYTEGQLLSLLNPSTLISLAVYLPRTLPNKPTSAWKLLIAEAQFKKPNLSEFHEGPKLES